MRFPVVILTAACLAATGAAAQLTVVSADARLARLLDWISAVERHEPGTIDEPARTVRLLDHAVLSEIREDMQAIGVLVHDPGAVIYGNTAVRSLQPGGPAPPRGYTASQVRALRAIAASIAGRGSITDLLKRGALLHTDIAFLLPPATEPVANASTPPLQRAILYLGDGRQQGLDQGVAHLDMARRLLDLVRIDPRRDSRPNPERDDMVRRWYRATAAVLIDRRTLEVTHFQRALQLFANDAGILFMAGVLREVLAAPRVQDGLRSARLPSGLSYDIDSERAELRRAETLFRRSLDADPDRVETRIRLGRVLGRLGRHADAARELRAAAAAATDPLLRYYAALFLGREADATGNRQEARTAYERASALYPRAQAPRVALSELAMRSGDTVAAMAALEPLWAVPQPQDQDEPWWAYYQIAGRDGEAQLAAVHAMFAGPYAETTR